MFIVYSSSKLYMISIKLNETLAKWYIYEQHALIPVIEPDRIHDCTENHCREKGNCFQCIQCSAKIRS